MKNLLLILIVFPLIVLSQTTIDSIHGEDVNNLGIHGAAVGDLDIHGYSIATGGVTFSNNMFFSFDGVGSYLNYDDDNDWAEVENEFTICYWFRAHDGLSGIQNWISSKGSGNYLKEFNVGYQDIKLMSATTIDYDASMTNNTWYHKAIIRDADDTIHIYVDGVLQADYATGITDDYIYERFGTNESSPPTYFANYDMDELMIFSDELSASDIYAISGDGSGDPLDAIDVSAYGDLIWWWRMGDDSNDNDSTFIDQQDSLDLDINNSTAIHLKSRIDSCIRFNTNESAASASAITFTDEFTISWWVYPVTLTNCFMASTSDYANYLGVSSSTAVSVHIAGSTAALTLDDSKTFSAEVWYNITVKRDSDDLITLYVNGIEQEVDTETQAGTLSLQSFGTYGGVSFTNAYFYQISFYNTDLSSDDIFDIKAGVDPTTISSCVNYWKMGIGDSGSTLTMYDSEGSDDLTGTNLSEDDIFNLGGF